MQNINRKDARAVNELRPIKVLTQINAYAEGSCLFHAGNTQVLCTASVEESVPPFLKGKSSGWVTAEYSMLPRASHTRNKREVKSGQSGRSHEIQRLIGRSLRTCVNLEALGERQIIIDCDVLQADGGTRTAAINGGFIALSLAVQKLLKNGLLKRNPIESSVAAISCGIKNDQLILDINYEEDSNIDTDANFVMNDKLEIVEIQATAEQKPFTKNQLQNLITLAQNGISQILEIQKSAIMATSQIKAL